MKRVGNRIAFLRAMMLLLITAFHAHAVHAAEKPNVLLIYSDDQGAIDLNCYGADDLTTPVLDGLAKRGVRFTRMYAPSAICSASRAGLLTGRFPARAGVPGNVGPRAAGMPSDEVTIAEMLKAAGYTTGHIGKWHLGHDADTSAPNAQGFDHSFGHLGGCIDNYSHYFYWNGPNRHDLWRNGEEVWADGRFFGDLMVEEVNAFVDQNHEEPFFIYWAINMPHYPYQGTAHWRAHYAHLPMPRREYAAFVSTMDEMIGQVLQHLEAKGLRDRTIVIFQSDHGHSREERAFGGGGNAGALRGAKGGLFEGGIRVPAIISWPQHLPKNAHRDQFVTGCDWLPTLAELCKAPLPQRILDGRSIVPVIQRADAPTPHDGFYWALGQQWAVREGDWKLLGNAREYSGQPPLTGKDALFLVNLADDPSESTNVAADHPRIVQRLLQRADRLFGVDFDHVTRDVD